LGPAVGRFRGGQTELPNRFVSGGARPSSPTESTKARPIRGLPGGSDAPVLLVKRAAWAPISTAGVRFCVPATRSVRHLEARPDGGARNPRKRKMAATAEGPAASRLETHLWRWFLAAALTLPVLYFLLPHGGLA